MPSMADAEELARQLLECCPPPRMPMMAPLMVPMGGV
jgi:hypothetical protein